MGWYDGEARRLVSADPPDGKYLPDEPASFAKSMNSSVKKRNLFRLSNCCVSAVIANMLRDEHFTVLQTSPSAGF